MLGKLQMIFLRLRGFVGDGGVNSVYISGILVMNSFNHNNVARKVNYILSTEGPLENFYFTNNTGITNVT